MSMRYPEIQSQRGFFIRCAVAAGLTTSMLLRPAEAYAEPRNIVDTIRDYAATTPLQLHKLRGNVTIIDGSGCNVAIHTGPDGKVFIDARITATRRSILDIASSLSHDPLKHLINAHWHFDHTDSNQWLNELGAAIPAQENTHKHLLSTQRVEDWDFNFPSPQLSSVPTGVFFTEKTVRLNRSTLHLKHYGPAYTDSDISMTFSERDTLHCGDTYWNGFYPFTNYSTGGSIDGMIPATEEKLSTASNQTFVIPGHNLPGHTSPVNNKAELVLYRDMLVAICENDAKLNLSTKRVPTRSFGWITRLRSRIARVGSTARATRQWRRSIAELETLDDHILKDIGIERSQISSFVSHEHFRN
jgi:glyoxylase-like metal-dependent hydrolase (beta-lactamase superfamily II)